MVMLITLSKGLQHSIACLFATEMLLNCIKNSNIGNLRKSCLEWTLACLKVVFDSRFFFIPLYIATLIHRKFKSQRLAASRHTEILFVVSILFLLVPIYLPLCICLTIQKICLFSTFPLKISVFSVFTHS